MTDSPATHDVLIIDDELQIRSVLRSTLETDGYTVREAENGRLALGEIALRAPDLILLDLGLPDRPGEEILRALRQFCTAPVLVITVSDKEDTKIALLDCGADDYMTKPFGTRELLARLRALQRRTVGTPGPTRITIGPLVIDLAHRQVLISGRNVYLTATEYSLLRILVVNRDRVVTHREVLREIWGPNSESQTHYLRTYMMRLRRKLGDALTEGGYLQTESGVGYRLVTDPH
jgi:two-component system KDP operon response regulator KdpE